MEDEDMSALDYAREHRLCRDYTDASVIELDSFDTIDTEESREPRLAESLLEPWNDVSADVKNDVWTLDLNAALYLRETLTFDATTEDVEGKILERMRQLRLEPPLLPNDEELDYQIFKTRSHDRDAEPGEASLLSTIELSPCSSNLQWPLMDDKLMSRVMTTVSGEKCELGLSACQMIKDIVIMAPHASQDNTKPDNTEDTRMSSPILPLSPSPTTETLPACEGPMDLTSSPTDPGLAELQHFNEQMIAETLEDCATVQMLDNAFEDISPSKREEVCFLPTLKRNSPADFKIDGPLTPFDTSSSPFKKIKLGQSTEIADSAFTPLSSTHDPEAESGYIDFFDQIVDLAAASVHKVENEQLQAMDTTLRMPVSVPTEIRTIPPWLAFSLTNPLAKGAKSELECQKRLLIAIEDDMSKMDRTWPVTGIHRLSWIPVPLCNDQDRLSAEVLEDEAPNESLQALFTEAIDPDAFSRKQPGLRVLDDYEADPDLEPSAIEVDETDILAALASRRYENLTAESQAGKAILERGTGSSNEVNRDLDRFFDLHSGRKPTSATQPLRRRRDTTHDPPIIPTSSIINITPTPPQAQLSPLPSPPTHCLLTSALLLNRPLITTLHALLPTTKFIERHLHPAEEGDLIPSPKVGLILTTTQKIKQRPLPGSGKVIGPVQGRIAALARRYERILVLVGDVDGRDMDEGDRAALLGLETIGSRGCRVDAVYVPGIEGMARRVAREICVFGNKWDEEGVGLDELGEEEETGLELELRRKGVNAFAALVVVAVLRGRGGIDVRSGISWNGTMRAAREVLEPLVGAEATRLSMEVLQAQCDIAPAPKESYRKPPASHRLKGRG